MVMYFKRRKKPRLENDLVHDDAENGLTPPHSNHDDDEDLPHKVPPSPVSSVKTTSTRKTFPSELKTIPCNFEGCDKKFNRPARLAAHMRSHNNDRPYKCTYPDCDKTYRESKHLKAHVASAHKSERKHVCQEEGCGKSFLTGSRLRRHQLVHEGKNRYRCTGYEGCDQSFRKHNTLARHVRVEHLGGKAFLCTVSGCDAGFDSPGPLRAHTQREHGQLQFWCTMCDEDQEQEGEDDDEQEDGGSTGRVGFTTQALLDAHMRHEHRNCMFCDVKCRGQAQLDQHIEIHHSGTSVNDRRTVSCTFPGCPKRFTQTRNMKAHFRSAHEGRRFICGEEDVQASTGWNGEGACGGPFTSKAMLEDHVRIQHMGMPRLAKDVLGVIEKKEPSRIEQLSGISDISRLTMACTWPGCEAKFSRNHELTKHLQAHLTSGEAASVLGVAEEEFGLSAEYGSDLHQMLEGTQALGGPFQSLWGGVDNGLYGQAQNADQYILGGSNIAGTESRFDNWAQGEAEQGAFPFLAADGGVLEPAGPQGGINDGVGFDGGEELPSSALDPLLFFDGTLAG